MSLYIGTVNKKGEGEGVSEGMLRRLLVCCSPASSAGSRSMSAVAPYSIGSPVAAVVPTGSCVFTEDWAPAPLLNKQSISHDTRVLTFGLPIKDKPLGLSTCACILAKGASNEEGEPLVRPYTPVSTNAALGSFELMVKIYPGGLSKVQLDPTHSPLNHTHRAVLS